MKLEVYTVVDKAVGAYLQPFFCRSKGEALRSFSDACNTKDNQFYKHSLDYELVYLGVWDDNAGVFDCNSPVRVVSANECLVPDNPFTEESRLSSSPTDLNGGRGSNMKG